MAQGAAGVGLTKALAFMKPGDCLVVWKLDRLGRSLPHLITTVADLKTRGVGFRSLTEQMDTTTPQGEFFISCFRGACPIRAVADSGAAQAEARGASPSRPGGRPTAIDAEKLAAVTSALDGGASKAAVCRTCSASSAAL